jgi:hypothetical protein
MPKKKNKEVPTSTWITIDRDHHAIKAAQLRAKLCMKYQRQMKSTANIFLNDTTITTDISKTITTITDDNKENDAKPSASTASSMLGTSVFPIQPCQKNPAELVPQVTSFHGWIKSQNPLIVVIKSGTNGPLSFITKS